MKDFPIGQLSRILNSVQMKQHACQTISTESKSVPVLNYLNRTGLIQEGIDSGVSLWMLQPHKVERQLNSAEATLLAGGFSLVADAIQLLLEACEMNFKAGVRFKERLTLLAEAQSMLHSIISSLELPKDDDQHAIFMLLRIFCKNNRVFLPQLSDSKREITLSEITSHRRRIEIAKLPIVRQRNIEILLTDIRQLILAAAPEDEKQWLLIAHRIKRLMSAGMRPSDVRLRDILLPAYEDIPTIDGCPKEFLVVMETIDTFLASRPDSSSTVQNQPPTQEVAEVRQLLEGRKVVLICGLERQSSKLEIERAFGLQELIWVSTHVHTPVEQFEPYVQTPNVAVVLLAIRFARHGYGKVNEYCEKAKLPFVRLPAGYGVNQIARQIWSQCGNRLKMSPLTV